MMDITQWICYVHHINKDKSVTSTNMWNSDSNSRTDRRCERKFTVRSQSSYTVSKNTTSMSETTKNTWTDFKIISSSHKTGSEFKCDTTDLAAPLFILSKNKLKQILSRHAHVQLASFKYSSSSFFRISLFWNPHSWSCILSPVSPWKSSSPALSCVRRRESESRETDRTQLDVNSPGELTPLM